MRDVIQKKCQNEGCEKVSTFGLQSRKPLFCVSHREEGMLDVIHKKCRTERCKKIPIFGLEQGEAFGLFMSLGRRGVLRNSQEVPKGKM